MRMISQQLPPGELWRGFRLQSGRNVIALAELDNVGLLDRVLALILEVSRVRRRGVGLGFF
jgi:hypothetical protein